jgi:hypothetical protein
MADRATPSSIERSEDTPTAGSPHAIVLRSGFTGSLTEDNRLARRGAEELAPTERAIQGNPVPRRPSMGHTGEWADAIPIRTWYSPAEIARSRGIRVSKVLTWVRNGELEAVNCAERPRQRPRWRVSAEALAAFDRGRSNRAALPVPRGRGRHRPPGEVTEYF